MHFFIYFLDFHFLSSLFIGICVFLSTPFKLEPSNFGSAHLLWIYYKWYFNFFYCWVMALFKILCTTIHSKFPLSVSDLNSDHIVQARIFIFWLKIALLNVLKVLLDRQWRNKNKSWKKKFIGLQSLVRSGYVCLFVCLSSSALTCRPRDLIFCMSTRIGNR